MRIGSTLTRGGVLYVVVGYYRRPYAVRLTRVSNAD